MTETWLVVFAGDANWREIVSNAVRAIPRAHEKAHEILFQESTLEPRDLARWGLLLVHWTAAERDRILETLQPLWDYGFVNRVHDLDD